LGCGFTNIITGIALDQLVRTLWKKGLAEATNKTVASEINTYLLFCFHYNLPAIPVTASVACKYVATLSVTHAYSSIKRYVSALGHLHKARGLVWNIPHDYHVYRVLQGVKRDKGGASFSKLHITPDILCKMAGVLNMGISEDLTFWAAALLAFYSFFRKSNVVPPSEDRFSSQKHLSMSDIKLIGEGAVVTVKWSKTIQFRERQLEIPIANSPLKILSFPDVWRVYAASTPGSLFSPAFRFRKGGNQVVATHHWFSQKLKVTLAAAGLEADKYSGHSFRSGGATFAFECGVPPLLIKMQGDWTSDAYLRYIRTDWNLKWEASKTMAARISET
jgi:hypothetical protein